MDLVSDRRSDPLGRIVLDLSGSTGGTDHADHTGDRLLDRLLIVGADHPSLLEAYEQFNAAIGELHSLEPEPDPATQSDAVHPRKSPTSKGFSGFRLAAMVNGHIIGAARVNVSGDLRIAVRPEYRGRGVATELSVACVTRARLWGYRRLIMRASHRSQRARQVSASEHILLLDRGEGRIDLMLDYAPIPHSA